MLTSSMTWKGSFIQGRGKGVSGSGAGRSKVFPPPRKSMPLGPRGAIPCISKDNAKIAANFYFANYRWRIRRLRGRPSLCAEPPCSDRRPARSIYGRRPGPASRRIGTLGVIPVYFIPQDLGLLLLGIPELGDLMLHQPLGVACICKMGNSSPGKFSPSSAASSLASSYSPSAMTHRRPAPEENQICPPPAVAA